MKRLLIASIIFTLTIGFCIAGFFAVKSSGEQMINIIESGIEEAESNPGDLGIIAGKINKEWSYRSTLFESVFIHDEFSEVETLINKLNVFAKQSLKDDFVECCNEAISRLRYALDNEKPKIQNIF